MDGGEEKFVRYLRRHTKTLIEVDGSHFWVSGYYAVHFYLKSKKDRAKMKRLVQEAIQAAGGFMTLGYWLSVRKGRQSNRFVGASGSGSNIRLVGSLFNPAYL